MVVSCSRIYHSLTAVSSRRYIDMQCTMIEAQPIRIIYLCVST